MVGSTISGFALDSSDVDMCIVSRTVTNLPEPRYEAFTILNELRLHLQQHCRKLSFYTFYRHHRITFDYMRFACADHDNLI